MVFEMMFRNGFGIDISLMPRQVSLGLKHGGGHVLVQHHLFQILLPFVIIQFGEYSTQDLTPQEVREFEAMLQEEEEY